MFKKIIAILATFGACAALADDASASSDDKTQALYIHPISLITTASVPGLPLWVFLTYEHELNKGQSLAVQPNLWLGTIGTGDDDKTDVVSFGLKAFYRKFFNGEKAEGMYLSPALEYSYYSFDEKHASYTSYMDTPRDLKLTEHVVSVLLYVGYRAKWSGSTLFIDAGLGRGFASAKGDDGVDKGSASGSGLDVGFNFGLGMPF